MNTQVSIPKHISQYEQWKWDSLQIERTLMITAEKLSILVLQESADGSGEKSLLMMYEGKVKKVSRIYFF